MTSRFCHWTDKRWAFLPQKPDDCSRSMKSAKTCGTRWADMLISWNDELKRQQKTLLSVHPPSKPDPCAPTTEELKTEDQQDTAGSMVVITLATLFRMLAWFLSFPSILSYRYPSSLFNNKNLVWVYGIWPHLCLNLALVIISNPALTLDRNKCTYDIALI